MSQPDLITTQGTYRLSQGRLLGQGSFGAVYEVKQPKIGQVVAVKVTGLTSRTIFEFDIMRTARHPNVMSLLDWGVQDGRLYLVMPLAEMTLETALKEIKADQATRVRWAGELAAGALYLASLGVLHLDLKPDNIMLTQVEGDLRITIGDFGIAAYAPRGWATVEMPISYATYLPPEEFTRGGSYREDLRTITTATMAWTIGVIAYEILAGPLFSFEKYIAEVPKAIQAWLTRSDRLATIENKDVREALDHILRVKPTERAGLDQLVVAAGLTPEYAILTWEPGHIVTKEAHLIGRSVATTNSLPVDVAGLDFTYRYVDQVEADPTDLLESMVLGLDGTDVKIDGKYSPSVARILAVGAPLFLRENFLTSAPSDQALIDWIREYRDDPTAWLAADPVALATDLRAALDGTWDLGPIFDM